MIEKLLDHLGLRKKPDAATVRFASIVGNFSVSPHTRVQEAKSVALRPQWLKAQLKSGHTPVASCPGMWDHLQAGFIIPAHCDIHIQADANGIEITPLGLKNIFKLNDEEVARLTPTKFDYDMVTGNAPIEDGLEKSVEKLPLPWGVFMQPGWSAYVMPALMHASYLDKIYAYPGVVDYDAFSTCNFIFSVLKPCEFVIYAGEPLLHVIPFRREIITADCGRATQEELDRHHFNVVSRKKGFYRTNVHKKKTFSLRCPFHAKHDTFAAQ